MTFAEKLLKFRAKHNLTQKQVADLFGVTSQMITAYEKGKSPSKKNVIRFEMVIDDYNG